MKGHVRVVIGAQAFRYQTRTQIRATDADIDNRSYFFIRPHPGGESLQSRLHLPYLGPCSVAQGHMQGGTLFRVIDRLACKQILPPVRQMLLLDQIKQQTHRLGCDPMPSPIDT